jgi:hypothetical protein
MIGIFPGWQVLMAAAMLAVLIAADLRGPRP